MGYAAGNYHGVATKGATSCYAGDQYQSECVTC